jgi:hypothetical protein
MWVLGSVAFLIAAGCVTIQVLHGSRGAASPRRQMRRAYRW